MLTCPYCGSSRLQTTGGDIGNPFDRRKEKTICLDCGRTIGTEPDIADLSERQRWNLPFRTANTI